MKYLRNKGITIIELVVGVGVLAMAIAGPMTLAASSLKATQDAKNELIATHLAEEAIEVIHSARDNNSARDYTPAPGYVGWLNRSTDIKTACTGNGCIVDVTKHGGVEVWATPLIGCVSAGCVGENVVYFNNVTGLFRQSASALGGDWTPSLFKRSVVFVAAPDTREAKMTSTVTYLSSRGSIRTITVSEVIYNWFPALQ